MPALFYLCASALAVVVTTGALLDRKKVRRSRRVLVWTFLFVFLPFSLLVLFVVWMSLFWHGC